MNRLLSSVHLVREDIRKERWMDWLSFFHHGCPSVTVHLNSFLPMLTITHNMEISSGSTDPEYTRLHNSTTHLFSDGSMRCCWALGAMFSRWFCHPSACHDRQIHVRFSIRGVDLRPEGVADMNCPVCGRRIVHTRIFLSFIYPRSLSYTVQRRPNSSFA